MAHTILCKVSMAVLTLASGRNGRLAFAIVMFFLTVAGGAGWISADTGIALVVDRGPGTGDVTLTWAGLQPTYAIFRSSSAAGVSDPVNEIGQTSSTSWIDSTLGQPILYYHVQSACDAMIDADGDGFSECDDCSDGDGSMFPGATERCNGIDDDCDLLIDEDFDVDGDGFSPCPGNPELFDCDDGNATVNPGVTEQCGGMGTGNGVDDDCDGYVDEVCQPCDASDTDSDGISECEGDCDPGDGTVFPGAAEICDGVDTDCDTFTVENCTAGEACNFPGAADVCEADLLCTCLLDGGGSCTGSYVCSGLCNYSETGAVGEGCALNETCLYDLLRSANLHSCGPAQTTLGAIQGGVACGLDEECRSGVCDRVCVGPGCNQSYCRDSCTSDTYCPAGNALCRLDRDGMVDIDGECWPASGPFLGAGAVGDACAGDTDCDHGFCANDGGSMVCTAACCTDADCPTGNSCSLRGDQVDTNFVYVPPGASTCTLDPDCPMGTICFMNECAWQLTETAPMCLPDVAGQGSLSAGSACAMDSDCRSNFCETGLGICIEVCCSDSDCGAGQACRRQVVQTTVNRATSARVCVTTSTDQVLQRN